MDLVSYTQVASALIVCLASYLFHQVAGILPVLRSGCGVSLKLWD